MKYSIASKCIYNRGGICYFLISDPQPCKLCVNFASVDPVLKKELKVDKPIVTFYDLIMKDSRYRSMFPTSGTSMQMNLYSHVRSEKLPDNEEENKETEK